MYDYLHLAVLVLYIASFTLRYFTIFKVSQGWIHTNFNGMYDYLNLAALVLYITSFTSLNFTIFKVKTGMDP